jgi:hypothetical protein
MNKLNIFISRLNKVGVKVEVLANFPWIYLGTVNGKKVTEKYEADWGFTVAFLPVRSDRPLRFTDLSYIFEIIRKYK